MITKFFKGMKPHHITQHFHAGHQATDFFGDVVSGFYGKLGFGTPLCAPEELLITQIRGDGFTPNDHTNFLNGYGIFARGIETGIDYLFWHTTAFFPVNAGDRVKRGGIICNMGNSGYVTQQGKVVPLEERDEIGEEAGTHCHVQCEKDGKRIDIEPLINWNLQPNYGPWDVIKASQAVSAKIKRLTLTK